MSETASRWAICPVEDCTYAIEIDAGDTLFCPSCEMELVSGCPACGAAVRGEEDVVCAVCAATFKQ